MGLVFEIIQGILNQCISHFCMEITYDNIMQIWENNLEIKHCSANGTVHKSLSTVTKDYIEEGSTSGEKVNKN